MVKGRTAKKCKETKVMGGNTMNKFPNITSGMTYDAMKIIHKELDADPELKRMYLQEKKRLDRKYGKAFSTEGIEVLKSGEYGWIADENQVMRGIR